VSAATRAGTDFAVAAGYVAVAIFGVAAGIAGALGLPLGQAAVVGAVAAAPVVVALIGDRVTRIKGFGVEVSLEKVTVDVAGDNSPIASDFSLPSCRRSKPICRRAAPWRLPLRH